MELYIKNRKVLIDIDDFPKIKDHNWLLLEAKPSKIYLYAHDKSQKGKTIYLHRLIMGTPAGLETDHINGDTLDNRKANLRIVTRSENQLNTHKHREKLNV